ncbi:MAG: hypothetical protein PHE09_21015 [Oscillospiraceae bacterium]|nr:hypothetical protein [Oscillospiraceae bacterium]
MKEPVELNGAIITDGMIEAIKDWQDEGSEFDIEAIDNAITTILMQEQVLSQQWDKAIDFLRLIRLLNDLKLRIKVFQAKEHTKQ